MVVFLIDNQSPNQKLAWTTDAQKIMENRRLLRSVPFANSIKISGKNDYRASLFSIGKYIAVVRIRPDEIPDKMFFFDHDWDISKSELHLLLQGICTEELEKEWFNIQWILYSTFTDELDIVELCKT